MLRANPDATGSSGVIMTVGIGRAVAIAKRQRHVASFQIAEIAQAGSKPGNVARRRCGGEGRENADQWVDRLLLRARRERPRSRTAERRGSFMQWGWYHASN